MPKQDINYNNSVIYKIQHQEKPELIYIGSTTDFTNRKAKHKNACNNSNNSKYNLKLYKMIRENEGWDAFKVIIIKEFPCASKVELLLEEDKMMLELKSSLNCQKAHRTDEELKVYMKEYYEANKDKAKEYYEANKDKIKEYQNEYREANKDKAKEWEQKNKDKRNARRRARYQAKKQPNEEQIDI